MARPKGSKDTIKRKSRNQFGFSQKEIDIVKKLKKEHLLSNEIVQLTNLSAAQLEKICKQNNIKQINTRDMSIKEDVVFGSNEKICGIYAIIVHRKDGYQGVYIGSSIDLRKRCVDHANELKMNKHYNKKMQIDFNDSIGVKFKVWSREKEEDLLKKESEIISQYYGLYNIWRNKTLEEMGDLLEIAILRLTESRYVVQKSGCWEYIYIHKTGYGRDIQVQKDNTIYFFKPHRLSYYKSKKEYPELIRHLCNNRRCINPDHLIAGSYSENGKDTNREKRELFIAKWKEFDGDYGKLTDFFGYKRNYKNRYSHSIRQMAKKLGLI